MLPAGNLILLQPDQYDICAQSNDCNRPHTLRVRGQAQFTAVFHHTQLFILAWLKKHGFSYDRYTFIKVIVDNPNACRNFLAGAGITLDLEPGEGGITVLHGELTYRKGKGDLTSCIWTKFVNKQKVLGDLLYKWARVNKLVVDEKVEQMSASMLKYLRALVVVGTDFKKSDSAMMKLMKNYRSDESDHSE